MDPHHRRVDVQSAADLVYLLSNVRAAARQKIDLHLPPMDTGSAGGGGGGGAVDAGVGGGGGAAAAAAAAANEDPLRKKVEELVEQYVVAVFREARKGVSVNGMEAGEAQAQGQGVEGLGALDAAAAAAAAAGDEGGGKVVPEFEFEPFDTRLADRIRALEATKEDLNAKVADLRRDAPRKAAARYEQALLADADAWEKQLGETRDELVREAAESARVDVGEMERWDEVRGMWEKGTDGLLELKGGLTETVARLERAEKVVGYLEGR